MTNLPPNFTILRLLFLLLSAWLLINFQNHVMGSQFFKPVWHTPNDFDLNGQTCDVLRPTVERTCPIFGVLATGKSQDEVEEQCASHGFSCMDEARLFIDGSCRSCEAPYEFVEEVGNVFCRAPDGSVQFDDLINPFDCTGEGEIPREIQGQYRPCYDGARAPQTQVIEYYAGDDFNNETTTASCADTLGLSAYFTEVHQNGRTQRYNFPAIRQSYGIENDEGYLFCPKTAATPYNYAAPGWIAVYAIYGFGALILVVFHFYKRYLERKLDNIGINKYTYKPLEEAQDDVMQTGYRNDVFGTFAFAYLVMLSVGNIIFLFLIILDAYGLAANLLCVGNTTLWENCEGNHDLNWRTGKECFAGCGFSFLLTNGEYSLWPYAAKSGGGENIYIVFITMWYITVVWTVTLKILQGSLRAWFRIKCPFIYATTVLCSRNMGKVMRTDHETESKVTQIWMKMEELKFRWFGPTVFQKSARIKYDENSKSRYFDFQCSRYSYSPQLILFISRKLEVAKTHGEAYRLAREGLSSEAVQDRRIHCGINAVKVKVPSIFRAYADEFFDYFYFFQFFCLFVWIVFLYWVVGVGVLVLVLISGGIRVFVRRQALTGIKKISENYFRTMALRDKKWVVIYSDDLVPGDVVKLEGGMNISADMILADGRCVMDESSLTGESTPVPKVSVCNDSDVPYDSLEHNHKYTLYAGSRLESTSAGETGETLGVVLSTGVSTGKGAVIKSLLFPTPESFTFDEHWILIFLVLIAYGGAVFLFTVYIVNGLLSSWFYGTNTMSQIVSPLIPAVFIAGATQGAVRLRKYYVYCANPHKLLVAGKVKVFCFDKTGTLTRAGLFYEGFCAVNEDGLLSSNVASASPRIGIALSTCNEIDVYHDMNGCEETNNATGGGDITAAKMKLAGNAVDVEIFKSMNAKLKEAGRQPIIEYAGEDYKVMRRFEFDRRLMTMSVIVKKLKSGEHIVYTKGGYENIAQLLVPGSIPANFHEVTAAYARAGFYVLALASSSYTGPEDFNVSRSQVERNMKLEGLILFLNEVKDDALNLMQELKEGAIRPVMITGDNILTAITVSRKISLSTAKTVLIGDVLPSANEISWVDYDTREEVADLSKYEEQLEECSAELAVTSKAFEMLKLKGEFGDKVSDERFAGSQMQSLLRYTRIFARMKPHDKVDAIKLHSTKSITGMCGDGANDAGALRAAHCGVALASDNSDISIVAPFTCSSPHLSAIRHIIEQGRCTLATAVAGFKSLMMYGEIMAIVSIFNFYMGTNPAEAFWFSWDVFITVFMSWCLLQSHPRDKLAPYRPTARLLGLETVVSTVGQVAINWFWYLMVVVYMYSSEWFVCKEFDANLVDQSKWYLKGQNYEAAVLGIFATFQFVFAAPVNNIGFDYRKNWWRNYYLVFYFAALLVVFLYMLLAPVNGLGCLFQYNCGDYYLVQRWIDIGRLPASIGFPTSMPIGCPCETQFDPNDELCESEYVNCDANQYNQRYHHDIVPTQARYEILGFILANMVSLFVFEGIFVSGPVRRYLRRKRKDNASKCKRRDKVIVGNTGISSEVAVPLEHQ